MMKELRPRVLANMADALAIGFYIWHHCLHTKLESLQQNSTVGQQIKAVLCAREIPVPWPAVHCFTRSFLLECPLGTLLYLNNILNIVNALHVPKLGKNLCPRASRRAPKNDLCI
jgi:hypothetical protein